MPACTYVSASAWTYEFQYLGASRGDASDGRLVRKSVAYRLRPVRTISGKSPPTAGRHSGAAAVYCGPRVEAIG